MKKMVVHRRREGPKQHPWLFLSGSVIVAGILIAGVVYLVVMRETPEKKAARLTRELVASIGERDWEGVRRAMGVPDGVDAAEFESWAIERYKILVDQGPLLLSTKIGEVLSTGESIYEVKYSLRFHYKQTDRRSNPEGVARWKYDEESDSMSYLIGEEIKEALEIE